jgi:hypothetical protein
VNHAATWSAAVRAALAFRVPYFWRGSALLPSVANWPQGCCQHLRTLFQGKPNWSWRTATKLAADLLGRRLGEGDPDPLADNLGQAVLRGHPAAEELKDLFSGEGAVCLALGVVHEREDPGGSATGLLGALLGVNLPPSLKYTLRRISHGVTMTWVKRKPSSGEVSYSVITPNWSDHQICSIPC